jgi:hypothetical protein
MALVARGLFRIVAILAVFIATIALPIASSVREQHTEAMYIVQATNADVAAAAVSNSGGTLVRRLPIINAVSARVSRAARVQLQSNAGI